MTLAQTVHAARGATGRGAHSGAEALAKGLGWFSLGIGLAELLGARRLCHAIGLEGREPLIRAYGVREAATGMAILMSHDPTPWIWGRLGGDALDLATLATGFKSSNGQAGALGVATAAVAGVTALDLMCAQSLTADKRLPRGRYDYSDHSGFPRPIEAMRGAASDFKPPADFRIPESLRPWRDGTAVPSNDAKNKG